MARADYRRRRGNNLDDLSWLVQSRNKIQSLMLELLQNPPRNAKTGDVHRLTSIAFSLWRAVFLAHLGDDGRSPKTIDRAARKFLIRLIETNTITFSDDRDSSRWSCGYYLNTARLRLKLPPIRATQKLKNAWDETFDHLDKGYRSGSLGE
jgi:hypothetical protein